MNIIKSKIKKYMQDKEIGARELSRLSGINTFKIFYLLFVPVSKIKFTQGISISTALNISLSNLHPF